MKFYVSHIGQNYGPWSVEEILSRMAKMELLASDFIFDESKNDWVSMMDFAPVADALKRAKPAAKPSLAPNRKPEIELTAKVLVQPENEKAEWFIFRDNQRVGPLPYSSMIRGLQEKSIFETEMIKKEGMNGWVRLAEHPEFSGETIKQLVYNSKVESSFFQRRHARFTYMNEVMIHDNRSLFMGQTFQGGEGGSGVIIENATLVLGQKLNLHFASHDGVKAFNAECEIVSKRFVKDVRSKTTPVPYGLKFLRIDSQAQLQLKDYFTNRIAV